MEIYIESMTKVVYSRRPFEQLIIRCWRQETEYNGGATDAKNIEEINIALEKLKTHDKYEIAEWLLQISRMNAVEVIDHTGFGCVLYKDWP